ncbi:hypothetical protein CEP52_011335 [Fusarium oligoseptatum]|uniref:Uncharacterized protein n=1 Tax=Fusarium oligoseptatum TaxID=2604345 RepID=A0A428T3T0_9HYPO|nr:hypothetical protein CEP52_011335 [Fusarium oligoseptatum]
MPPRPPRLDRLLALLEEYLAPKELGLPGGVAKEKELVWAEKDSPVKGEFITPGPWPSLATTIAAAAALSSSSTAPPPPTSDAAPAVSSPGSSPPVARRRRRLLRRLLSCFSSSA